MLLRVISSFKFTAAPLTHAAGRQMPFHVASFKALAAGKVTRNSESSPPTSCRLRRANKERRALKHRGPYLNEPGRTMWRPGMLSCSQLVRLLNFFSLLLHLESRCISSGLRCRSLRSPSSCGETFIFFPTRTHVPSISGGAGSP